MKFKKTVSAIISACLFVSCTPNIIAADNLIYQNETQTPLSKGVTLSEITRFYTDGWQKINVVTADLTQPHIVLKTLTGANGIKQLSSVGAMAENFNAIAAVNADFFDYNKSESSTGSPLGLVVSGGEMLTTPSHDHMPAIAQTVENDMFISLFDYSLSVTAPNGESHGIMHLNKYMSPTYLTVYDKNWGKLSPGSHDDGIEVVVEDGIVTKILSNSDGVEIPENGYVLNHSLRYDLFLAENFQVGDKALLNISLSPDIEKITTAVGGSTFLLKDGKTAAFTYKTSGVNPKTAAGIDKSGKTLFLVTVDGRNKQARGMTQSELAAFMAEIGAYNAIDFDGGGSTTMVAKLPDNDKISLINTPSDGSQRRVSNALGIQDISEKGEIAHLKITPKKDAVFIGDRLEFDVKAYDEYYHKSDISGKKFDYSSDGGPVAANKIFYPKTSGIQTINATYADSIHASAEVHVLDKCVRLEISPPTSDLSKQKNAAVSVKGYDSEGFCAEISPDMVEWEIVSGNGATVKDGVISLSGNADATVIKASFGDGEGYLAVNTSGQNNEDTFIPETYPSDKFLKNTDDKTGDKTAYIGFFGDGTDDSTLFSSLIKNIRNKVASRADTAVFKLMPVNAPQNSVSASRGYKILKQQDYVLITLNNSSGGIRASNSQQWSDFMAAIKTLSQKNILIAIPKPADGNGFSDEYELALFKQILSEKLYGDNKNVFVISYGTEPDYKVENGIRYITVPDLPVRISDMFSGVYLKVSIDADDVSCEFMPYFK